jgi:hypothetical protein
MSERKTYGWQALWLGVFTAAALLVGYLESASGWLENARARGGLPELVAELFANPVFPLILGVTAVWLGYKAITSEPDWQAKAAALEGQAAQIEKWRAMLSAVHSLDADDRGTVLEELEKRTDYLSLRPRLSQETIEIIYTGKGIASAPRWTPKSGH